MSDTLIQGFDDRMFCSFLNFKFSGSFSPSRSSIPVKEEFAWEHAERLGIVKTLAGAGANMPLLVIAAKLPEGEKLKERSSRVKQFKFAKQILDDAMSNPAPGVDGVLSQGLFVFYDDHGNFRLSLVYGKAEGIKLVWSTAKRLSFYVEAGTGNKTFRDRTALDWHSFDKLKEAFSVEKLTKEFYGKLFAWYLWALSNEMNVTYPNKTDTDDDNREINEHIIRLITRLMFVWFLKQKHLVPETLFDPVELKKVLKNFDQRKGDNYYRAILQNLFFATLNSEIPKRAFAVDAGNVRENKEHFDIKTLYRYGGEFSIPHDKVLELFEKVPFLNGGLFECLDRGIDYSDGFSRNTARQAQLPNQLFFDEEKGLIPLLNQYNFTVEENSPGDEEVALDPELLGKVFENLLGAYNPETEVVARKATGSFYTPREIVNYMVDESLKAHVSQKVAQTFLSVENKVAQAFLPVSEQATLPVPSSSCEAAIQALFATGERPSDEQICKAIDDALVSAKILDPACGSGAFPMGILLRMVELLRILRSLPEEASVYDLKLELIENCIYGNDIQCIAVQIAKLRFFISLVCEENSAGIAQGNIDIPVCATQAGMPVLPCAANNYGIHTLPNLETKFVAADSLIGLPRSSDTLPMQNVEQMKQELWAVRHKHFLARTYHEKRDLREEDKTLREKLAKELEQGGGFDTASAKLMAAWDPYDQNASAPFFDPEWMFNVKEGFDVVIGNPPYIHSRSELISQSLKEYCLKNYTTVEYQINTFVVFTELGVRLLNQGGVLSYIIPNYWLSTANDFKLRKFLFKDNWVREIVNVYRVFEAATVDTLLLSVVKTNRPRPKKTIVRSIEKSAGLSSVQLEAAFTNCVWQYESEYYVDDQTADIQVPFKNQVSVKSHLKMGDYFIFKFGIKLYELGKGVPPQTKQCITNRVYNSDRCVNSSYSPLVGAGNIKRYFISGNKTWIKYGEHLAAPRSPTLFSGPRILLCRIIGNRLDAMYCEDWLPSNTDVIILKPKENLDVNALYYLGVLCSTMCAHLAKSKNINLDRQAFPKINTATLESLPVPDSNAEQQNEISQVVESVLASKKSDPTADTSALEAEIDQLVYQLYGLTEEEIAIVEGSTGIPACVKQGSTEIPVCDRVQPTQTGMSVLPSKKKRKQKLPPSLPGWD